MSRMSKKKEHQDCVEGSKSRGQTKEAQATGALQGQGSLYWYPAHAAQPDSPHRPEAQNLPSLKQVL